MNQRAQAHAPKKLWITLLWSAALLGLSVLACTPTSEETDCTTIGALLPFTGPGAAIAANIERGLLLTVEQLNAGLATDALPFCLQARDSRSDARAGLAAAEDLVLYHRVPVLIGPHNDDLALRIVEMVRQRPVLGVSGGTASPALSYADDGGRWFRTVPSAVPLGQALARKMYEDGVRTISVIYESSAYGTGWANVLTTHFTVLGGHSSGIYSFQKNQTVFTDLIRQAFSPDVDAVVLVAKALKGATIVGDWASSGRGRRWYFVPELADPVFLENIPPGVVDGMQGVVPALQATSAHFAKDFGQRWPGDQAARATYFYHDAISLTILASTLAHARHPDQTSEVDLAIALRDVANPPGQVLDMSELTRAMDLAAQGVDIDFQGATGDLDFDPRGDVAQSQVEFWYAQGNQIVYQ